MSNSLHRDESVTIMSYRKYSLISSDLIQMLTCDMNITTQKYILSLGWFDLAVAVEVGGGLLCVLCPLCWHPASFINKVMEILGGLFFVMQPNLSVRKSVSRCCVYQHRHKSQSCIKDSSYPIITHRITWVWWIDLRLFVKRSCSSLCMFSFFHPCVLYRFKQVACIHGYTFLLSFLIRDRNSACNVRHTFYFDFVYVLNCPTAPRNKNSM